MALKKPKIVIWCGAGANQKALANKIASEFEVAGIVIDIHSGPQKKRKLSSIPAIIWDRLRFKKIYNAWKNLMSCYDRQFIDWPEVPVLKVYNINDEQTRAFTEKHQPDLVVVSGTALIKKDLLTIPLS